MKIWFFHSAWLMGLLVYVVEADSVDGWFKGMISLASLICFGIGSIIMEIRSAAK